MWSIQYHIQTHCEQNACRHCPHWFLFSSLGSRFSVLGCMCCAVLSFIGFDIRRRIDMFEHNKIVEILWLSLYLPIYFGGFFILKWAHTSPFMLYCIAFKAYINCGHILIFSFNASAFISKAAKIFYILHHFQEDPILSCPLLTSVLSNADDFQCMQCMFRRPYHWIIKSLTENFGPFEQPIFQTTWLSTMLLLAFWTISKYAT